MRLPSAALLFSSHAALQPQQQTYRTSLYPCQPGWNSHLTHGTPRTSLNVAAAHNYFGDAPWDNNNYDNNNYGSSDAAAQLHDIRDSIQHVTSNLRTDLFHVPHASDDARWMNPPSTTGSPMSTRYSKNDPFASNGAPRRDLSQLAGLGNDIHVLGGPRTNSMRSSYYTPGGEWGHHNAPRLPQNGASPAGLKRDLTMVEPVRGLRGMEQQNNKNVPRAYYRQPFTDGLEQTGRDLRMASSEDPYRFPPSNVQRNAASGFVRPDSPNVHDVSGIRLASGGNPHLPPSNVQWDGGYSLKQDLGGPRRPVSEIRNAYDRGPPVSEIRFQQPPPGMSRLQQHVPNNSQQLKKDISFVQGPQNEIHSVGRGGDLHRWGPPAFPQRSQPQGPYASPRRSSSQPFRDMSQLSGNTGSEIRDVGSNGIRMPLYSSSPRAVPYNNASPAASLRNDISELRGIQNGIHQIRGLPTNNSR